MPHLAVARELGVLRYKLGHHDHAHAEVVLSDVYNREMLGEGRREVLELDSRCARAAVVDLEWGGWRRIVLSGAQGAVVA